MSNSSYLICIGDGSKGTKELYAEHTLPDGWAQLFAPEDFHVGHPRDHAVAAAPYLESRKGADDREVTSYLFCESAVALPRFAARMAAAKLPITEKGMIAKLHTWLAAKLAGQFWFADTSELEWMEERPGAGVEAIRRALVQAATTTRFEEPTPASMLLTFGSGTGLSDEEKARGKERRAISALKRRSPEAVAEADAMHEASIAVEAARKAPIDVATLQGRPYSVRETFTVGEQIAHPVFLTGTVTAAALTTITVKFASGAQLLAHGRR